MSCTCFLTCHNVTATARQLGRAKLCVNSEAHGRCPPLPHTSCFCCLSLRSCFKYQSLFSGRSPRSPRAAADRASYKTAASSCSRARSILDKAEEAGEREKGRTGPPFPCRLPVPLRLSITEAECFREKNTILRNLWSAPEGARADQSLQAASCGSLPAKSLSGSRGGQRSQ